MSRRGFLLASATGVGATTGCLDGRSEDGGPRDRAFDVAITASDGEPAGTVEGADVEDVVQVHVGDTVRFTFTNETDEPVGVHDHAGDAEVAVDPGAAETMEFEVTEAMIGRQEIEAWFTDDRDDRAEEEHSPDATPIVIVEVRPRGS